MRDSVEKNIMKLRFGDIHELDFRKLFVDFYEGLSLKARIEVSESDTLQF